MLGSRGARRNFQKTDYAQVNKLEPKEPSLVDMQQQNGYLGSGIRLEV